MIRTQRKKYLKTTKELLRDKNGRHEKRDNNLDAFRSQQVKEARGVVACRQQHRNIPADARHLDGGACRLPTEPQQRVALSASTAPAQSLHLQRQ